MYLLNTHQVELRFFSSCDATPPFAILSHVWGRDEQTFQEIQDIMKAPSADGEQRLSPKIRDCCRLARNLGFDWVWVDTCCINKESSGDLDEAINFMFVWYGHAKRCLAYLEDVLDDKDVEDSFLNSRWFKRGWTLQELIAPRHVIFLSRTWTQLGTKKDLVHILHRITGIDVRVLTFECDVKEISVGQRLSWAAGRETTKVEDEAYCLVGIFGIDMPTIYGEGRAAFRRLQKEILKRVPDQTLFAWENDAGFGAAEYGLLAPDPTSFRGAGDLKPLPTEKFQDAIRVFVKALGGDGQTPIADVSMPTFAVTNIGIHACLPVIECEGSETIALGVLAIQRGDFYVSLVLIHTGVLESLPLYSCGGYQRWGGGVRTLELRDDPVHGGMWALWDEPGNGKPRVSWKEIYISGTSLSALDDLSRGALHRVNLQQSLTVSIPAWVLSDLSMSGFTTISIRPNWNHQPVRIFPPVQRAGYVDEPVPQTPITLAFRCMNGNLELHAEETFQLHLEIGEEAKQLQASVVFPSRAPQPSYASRHALAGYVANWPGGARTFTQRDAGGERSVRLRFIETQGTSDLLLEIELGGEVYSRLRMRSRRGYLSALAEANEKEMRQQAEREEMARQRRAERESALARVPK